MPKFKTEFVHCMWDEKLKGKNCFVADSIVELQERVESNNTKFLSTVVSQHHGAYPFQVEYDLVFTFCYYDPYYDPYEELKLAYEQGKNIEVYDETDGIWKDVEGEPAWYYAPSFYRIKTEEDYVTHRELAKWVANGYGQVLQEDSVYTQFVYDITNDNKEVSKDCLVRAWGDAQWSAVTKEYLEAWS